MRPIDRLVIVGVGLVGASFGAAVRHRRLARAVIGVGRSADNLALAKTGGCIDETSTDPRSAVAGADMVVVATPVETALSLLPELASAADAAAVLTDVGSVKAPICSLAEEIGIGGRFIGGHPLAGGTASGAGAADPSLFEGATVLLCRPEGRAADPCDRVAELWRVLGARVTELSADEHDRQLAATSHLPQLLSSALALSLSRARSDLSLAGPVFAEMTRVAASEPEMWSQICRANKVELTAALGGFAVVLDELRSAVEDGDGERLAELFDEARRFREKLEGR